MSETTNEILEITDSSINIEISPVQDNGNKRRLSEIDKEFECDKKKLCTDSETEKLESTSSILEETIIEKEEVDQELVEETVVCLDSTSKLHTSSESECILEEIAHEEESPSKEKEEQPSIQTNISKNEEFSVESDDSNSIGDVEQHSVNESEEDDEIDDDALMLRVNNSLPLNKDVQNTFESNSEPIALDSDTEEEENHQSSNADEDEEMEEEEDENSEDFHEDTQSEGDEATYGYSRKRNRSASPKSALRMRLLNYNPRFYYARVLVKKSVKFVWRKQVKSENIVGDVASGDKSESLKIQNTETAVEESANVSNVQLPNENKANSDANSGAEVDAQDDVEMTCEAANHIAVTTNESESSKAVAVAKESKIEKKSNKSSDDAPAPAAATATAKENDGNARSSQNHVNAPDLETHFLLNEIESFSVDEIMRKYVLRNADQSSTSQQPTLDEFSEELFFCLQQNKIEIQKAQQIWNEKVHLKFKIRELMERIRRHRAVTDIENFGYKPAQEGQQGSSGAANVLISSKSSTTNSENDHFERSSKLTSESVNRLIQDVKANVLKKEQHQQRMDFSSAMNAADSFDENSSFGLNPNMQSFGRQGQTIDVQSIINDFRQKNPQEIPRRGRRVKNSFEENFMNEGTSQNRNDKSNNAMKSSNSSGFPEVSLVPVNNFYKNHSNSPATSSPFGKSSLLQSILTKQTTKSPVGYPPSSTLQRLLTAPERSFQSVSRQGHVVVNTVGGHSTKVHNNGEITITPIAGTSRKQDYSMDDEEENSTEPPLVIDESEDFELSDRTRELICQGCRKNKALFMCAGCSRQWYCSKECQELAWNDHENSCF